MKKVILISQKHWDAILILGVPVVTLVITIVYFAITKGTECYLITL
jgi:hypothetical protein